MRKLLLTVERVFTIAGRGVIVEPKIPAGQVSAALLDLVTLKRPDGTTVSTKAALHREHLQTRSTEQTLEMLKKPGYTCLLKDIDPTAVPVSTEIWIE